MSIIDVDLGNVDANPSCPHGPTLLFTRLIKGKSQKFYACSACRDRKECPFFLLEGEKITDSKRLFWKDLKENFRSKVDPGEFRRSFLAAKKIAQSERTFCVNCGMFVDQLDEHATHELKKGITDSAMMKPSLVLNAIQNDKKEAQFWFNNSSKRFILDAIKALKVDHALCIGSPTLHEELNNSLLLDIDHRYYSFYEDFIWFNMFNFHFMNRQEDRDSLEKHLSCSTCVIIDPPFGARLEPISYLISKLKQISSSLQIMLVLPYFMEPQVLKHLDNFEMLDYAIEYSNHDKFKTRNKPSPVRIFTNADCKRFKMPQSEGYWFCETCQRWRASGNRHCDICTTCTSKNGEKYLHCPLCDKCVKSTWAHCVKCNSCSFPEGHTCKKQGNKSRKIEMQIKKTKR